MKTILCIGCAAVLSAAAPSIGFGQCIGIEDQKLLASDGGTDSKFGDAVAMDGDWALVGAGEHGLVGARSGAAYAFHRSQGVWSETQILSPPDAQPDDRFGNAVSLRGDLALVGAYFDTVTLDLSGSAYVYRRVGSDWLLEQKLVAEEEIPDGQFGWSVAIDGDFAMVGTLYEKIVYVFHHDGSVWTQIQEIVSARDSFGRTLDLSGDRAVIAAESEERAYIYRYDGTRWLLETPLAPSGGQGSSFAKDVAIDGHLAVVGAPTYKPAGANQGGAFVFRFDGTSWNEEQVVHGEVPGGNERLGHRVAVCGDLVACGAPARSEPDNDIGAAFVFRHNAVGWVRVQELRASNGVIWDRLGSSVATNGDTVLSGAPGANDLARNSGSVCAFSVPPLALFVDPDVVATGDPLDVHSCGGQPHGPVILAAIEVDGIPIFQIIAIARFDSEGGFSLSGNIPPGLEGRVLTLQTMGRVDINVIAESERATLTISL